MPAFKPSDCEVLFDFDNTITSFDVLDDVIERFSVNNEWEKYEKLWQDGKIGSRECLNAQIGSVKAEKGALLEYLGSVKLVPYFMKTLAVLDKKNIPYSIVSDSFSFMIKNILKANGVCDIRILSNEIRFVKNRIVPYFPHTNPLCGRCAHCKTKQVMKREMIGKTIIYVGDGLSDLCPALHSDIVFAKGKLLKKLKEMDKKCHKFDDFKEVYDYLKEKK